jgi:hypothetical protein
MQLVSSISPLPEIGQPAKIDNLSTFRTHRQAPIYCGKPRQRLATCRTNHAAVPPEASDRGSHAQFHGDDLSKPGEAAENQASRNRHVRPEHNKCGEQDHPSGRSRPDDHGLLGRRRGPDPLPRAWGSPAMDRIGHVADGTVRRAPPRGRPRWIPRPCPRRPPLVRSGEEPGGRRNSGTPRPRRDEPHLAGADRGGGGRERGGVTARRAVATQRTVCEASSRRRAAVPREHPGVTTPDGRRVLTGPQGIRRLPDGEGASPRGGARAPGVRGQSTRPLCSALQPVVVAVYFVVKPRAVS